MRQGLVASVTRSLRASGHCLLSELLCVTSFNFYCASWVYSDPGCNSCTLSVPNAAPARGPCARRRSLPPREPAGAHRPRPPMASWDATLNQLEAPTPQLRTEAIDQLTELLQQSEWVLPQGRGGEVAAALRDRLVDSNW